MNIEKDIENVAKRAEDNARKIEENATKIHQNTGALEVLHTIKANTILFFVMWLITFLAFIVLLIYTIHITEDISVVNTDSTQEVEQESESGSNYFVGRDGEING